MTTLAWINNQTNRCDNVTLDPRPASEIQIAGYTIKDLNEIGGGAIGDTWDGEKLVSPQPEEPDQPQTSGTQEL